MPIYEYACARCGEFEVMQRITEPSLTSCPTCEGQVTKLISTTSFQLKGTGWYLTDYARKDTGAARKSDGEGAGHGKPEGSGTSAGPSEKATGSTAAGAAAAA